MQRKLLFLLGMVLFLIATPSAIAQVADPIATPFFVRADGTLVKTENDPRVYIIEHGKKRWIENGDIFLAQGFKWGNIITVSIGELANYPDGPSVTAEDKIILPGDIEVLPDLVPLAATDLRISTVAGRKALRFTATFWNQGGGPHQLVATDDSLQKDPDGNKYYNAFQRIIRKDGTVREVGVGALFWHAIHAHYHYDNFATYQLKMVKPTVGNGESISVPIVTEKSTFCMRDDVAINLTLPGAPKRAIFGGCGALLQGVSVGWADKYPYTLPDQYFDIRDLPAGIYEIKFIVDPLRRFFEATRSNNDSVTIIELDPTKSTLKVLASGAAYSTNANTFFDGMLIRAEGTNDIYVMKNNKKRLLRSPEIFASYGYADGQVYTLPASVVEAIPNINLVRVRDTSAIYALNEHGYRRHILSPSIFSSYGFTMADVAEINATEFAGYPDTDLVMWVGDSEERVFSMSRRTLVGSRNTLADQKLNQNSLHIINSTDFSAYAVTTIADKLTVPWAIAFLPDGDMLVTERPGTLRRIGKRNVVVSLPAVVTANGEGGLMGIALHPKFTENKYVYLYFTTNIDGTRSNRVERFILEGDILVEDKVIISGIAASLYHDGGQIAFGPDNMLYITTGDASVPESAQDLNSLSGKTLRLTDEGRTPLDNPFGTAIWSYGHRNAQGLAWDAQGRLWETEHGRSGIVSGFDEVNLVEHGKNYGWPVIQGDEQKQGMVAPSRHSTASVTWAPSGLAHYKGTLFFAGLLGQTLYEVTLADTGAIVGFHGHLVKKYGRLRAVVLGPDNMLYVTTSNKDGRGAPKPNDDLILRVSPDMVKVLR